MNYTAGSEPVLFDVAGLDPFRVLVFGVSYLIVVVAVVLGEWNMCSYRFARARTAQSRIAS